MELCNPAFQSVFDGASARFNSLRRRRRQGPTLGIAHLLDDTRFDAGCGALLQKPTAKSGVSFFRGQDQRFVLNVVDPQEALACQPMIFLHHDAQRIVCDRDAPKAAEVGMAYYEAAVPYSCRDVGNHLCRRRAVKDRRELRTGALADVQQRTQQIEIEVRGVPNVERASSRMGRAFRAGDTALQ